MNTEQKKNTEQMNTEQMNTEQKQILPKPILPTGIIYCGDCQDIMKDERKFPNESIDLIYLDPPFFSKKDYEDI